jgi:hypothetical protein
LGLFDDVFVFLKLSCGLNLLALDIIPANIQTLVDKPKIIIALILD